MSQKSEFEEEKKEEGTGNKSAVDSDAEIEDKNAPDSDSDDDDEWEELSPEILALLGGEDSRYESKEELRGALDKAGVGDLPIVLVDGKPCEIIAGHQHNDFTAHYVSELIDARNLFGANGEAAAERTKLTWTRTLLPPAIQKLVIRI